ncbi:MAG: rRNA pseudouridine synthase [Clostridiales bacterium]|uniref:pseudouridine synthase n=1 Tax=Clostridium sp. N3C TaxID=1776758 RepID=UPI00092DF1DB|nr:pseudouridine synthase [Clostridium sp. N3C]NLZ49978.1 rRNA pseudouridine synthase [Clostridiales bacterium]SCN22377.1 Ribosomal large subunit pseudouridine synthase B [Clostridium sp. N3C]
MEERLQKYMAHCGVASRRKCEELILDGKVKVNNQIVKELGTKVNPSMDKVEVDGVLIKPEERKIYIALNKPVGYVTTVKDEKNRKTVLDLVKVEERIYPIGRLDYNTSGLLLLTNDGEVYNKVIHPRQSINKVYIALIKGHLTDKKIELFSKGIDIGGYITAPAKIRILKKFENSSEVEITIHEGKNRQIRRMCEKIGNPVIQLKRIKIGDIKLEGLAIGKWRYLSEKEIKYLKNL